MELLGILRRRAGALLATDKLSRCYTKPRQAARNSLLDRQTVEVPKPYVARRWCERGDSNPHGLPHWILSPARLPFRHFRA